MAAAELLINCQPCDPHEHSFVTDVWQWIQIKEGG